MQKAVVASDIGWAQEIITDGKSGFLVHPKKHEAFAAQINLLLKDSDRGKILGVAAKNAALEKFELSLVSAQNIAFYEDVLRKYRAGIIN